VGGQNAVSPLMIKGFISVKNEVLSAVGSQLYSYLEGGDWKDFDLRTAWTKSS
jgi:hypothetical protein